MAVCPLSFSDLPSQLAVFPLTGALLLPGGQLPLNIFEPRYLTMFRDAMATEHRLIGMVQARPDSGEMGSAALYSVGCAGRLTAFSETGDGRYLINLSGLIRFDILKELPLDPGGYRLVEPDFLGYDGDLIDGGQEEETLGLKRRAPFLKQMRAYFDAQGFETDWDQIHRAPLAELVTSLAMACPFSPAEKQAVLEALSLDDRVTTLEGLLALGALDTQGQTH